ncbi:CUGBP Elav-like family member 1 [Platysternon megacephalum]|uniref:CUGBP Elav-like family member 1 n=1 Tax=Platysternon megacephalum TaxID=55544 RepID=A0A4D9EWH5_9SAUR|nr:CUGBP Elav-like family member 1 [Platysternon megacephalum]
MDPSSDYQFLNEILGKAVKITLKCGIFQGILQHVDSSRSIVLSRVKNLETGRSMAGVKMFFGYEIVNVELLEELDRDAARGAATPIRRKELLHKPESARTLKGLLTSGKEVAMFFKMILLLIVHTFWCIYSQASAFPLLSLHSLAPL